MSPESELKDELRSGRVKVLADTDRLEWHGAEASMHTSCFYNYFSKQLVGNYENLVFAQPVGEWCLVSYKSDYGNLNCLMGMDMANVGRGDLPNLWGPDYQRYYLGLGKYDTRRLEIPSLPQEESAHASSRDQKNLANSPMGVFEMSNFRIPNM